jgi:hypothetical protein
MRKIGDGRLRVIAQARSEFGRLGGRDYQYFIPDEFVVPLLKGFRQRLEEIIPVVVAERPINHLSSVLASSIRIAGDALDGKTPARGR